MTQYVNTGTERRFNYEPVEEPVVDERENYENFTREQLIEMLRMDDAQERGWAEEAAAPPAAGPSTDATDALRQAMAATDLGVGREQESAAALAAALHAAEDLAAPSMLRNTLAASISRPTNIPPHRPDENLHALIHGTDLGPGREKESEAALAELLRSRFGDKTAVGLGIVRQDEL